MVLIAPSLLTADLARLGEALHLIKEAGASMVHVDVMDGHFVPDISVGQPVIKSLRKATDLVLDLHLLIERPERYAGEFVEIGADRYAYVHVARGSVKLNGVELGEGDGARIRTERELSFSDGHDAEVLVFDLRNIEVSELWS